MTESSFSKTPLQSIHKKIHILSEGDMIGITKRMYKYSQLNMFENIIVQYLLQTRCE